VRVNQDYHKKAKYLDTRLGWDQQGGFDAELSTFGRDGVNLGPIVGAFGEMPSQIDLLADVSADALRAENLSYTATGAQRPPRSITAGCFIARRGSPPIAGGHALCSIAGDLYKPRTPHGTKANTHVIATTTSKSPLTKTI